MRFIWGRDEVKFIYNSRDYQDMATDFRRSALTCEAQRNEQEDSYCVSCGEG